MISSVDQITCYSLMAFRVSAIAFASTISLMGEKCDQKYVTQKAQHTPTISFGVGLLTVSGA